MSERYSIRIKSPDDFKVIKATGLIDLKYAHRSHSEYCYPTFCNIEENRMVCFGVKRENHYSLQEWLDKFTGQTNYLQDNTTFKVGDRVECIGVSDGQNLLGEEGVILYISNGNPGRFGVEFDSNVGGHNLYQQCEDGHGKFVDGIELKKVNNSQTKTTKEDTMNINDNVLEVFENSKDAKKVANRFGTQYGTTDRDTLALKRDKKDLLAIIAAEEKEAAEAN